MAADAAPETNVPELPPELYEAIVNVLDPPELFVCSELSMLFKRLCCDQDRWHKHCSQRWSMSVPPTKDYRRHYAMRHMSETGVMIACDARISKQMEGVPIKLGIPHKWPYQLLVEILDHDGNPMLTRCLPLCDASIEGHGKWGPFLTWSEFGSQSIGSGLGACFLWDATCDRLCPLIPPRNCQKESLINMWNTSDRDEELCRGRWTYRQMLNVDSYRFGVNRWGLHCDQNAASRFALEVHLEVAIFSEGEDKEASDPDQNVLEFTFEFLVHDANESGFLDDAANHMNIYQWEAIFGILPWGKAAEIALYDVWPPEAYGFTHGHP